MKPHHCLLALVSLVLASCASSSPYKAKPGTPASLTVGVRQFTTKGYASLPVTDRGVRDYEHLALPGFLVQALNGTPGIAKAYFVPANSPSVDVTVDGSIVKSNGRDLSLELTMTRSDGQVLGRKVVSLSHAPVAVDGIRVKNAGFFSQAAAGVAACRAKYAYDADDLRALVYAEAKVPSTPELVRMGKEAAEVERTQIFVPLSSALTTRVSATSNLYYTWQKTSVPFVNERDKAQAAKSEAEASQAFGALMSFAGGMAGGYSASQGNSLGMLEAMPIVTGGMEISAQGAADEAVAQAKINELSAQLARISHEDFGTGAGREVTVRIYNKVYTLKGSKAEMTTEFRKIVKAEMEKELSKPHALASVVTKS